MKLITFVFLTFGAAPAFSQELSPNKVFVIRYFKSGPHESDVNFIRTSDGKVLYTEMSSGIETHGFNEIAWSPDSKYLAVAISGTKTTVGIAVYHFDDDSVTAVSLPHFKLNLLGRHNFVRGGRYSFSENLVWAGEKLTFSNKGRLIDGASNPTNAPENWYNYEVTLGLSRNRERLSEVRSLK